MNAVFFGLAALAALNPKLVVIDLMLVNNRRPRPMFVCFLLGGMGLAITVGLLDVLVLQLNAVKTQKQASGWLDLTLGVPLLIIGVLLASNRLHVHRHRRPGKDKRPRSSKLDTWVDQALSEPRYLLAFLIGAAVGTPGFSYILALHNLVSSQTPSTVAAIAVLLFVIINFAVVLVPFVLYLAHPQRTEDAIRRFKDWIFSHHRQIAAAVALIAGAYMVVSGVSGVL
jgi:hypothetical protein